MHVFETAVRRVYVTYDEVSFRTQPCGLDEWDRWKKSEGIRCMSLQRERKGGYILARKEGVLNFVFLL